MTLIDKDALMETIRENHYQLATRQNSIDNGMFTIGIQQGVDEQPTIEIVRCVECQNRNTSYCPLGDWTLPRQSDFCSYGHKKEG